jgi:hypothetical protein
MSWVVRGVFYWGGGVLRLSRCLYREVMHPCGSIAGPVCQYILFHGMPSRKVDGVLLLAGWYSVEKLQNCGDDKCGSVGEGGFLRSWSSHSL